MTHRLTSERTRSHVERMLMMATGIAVVAAALIAHLPASVESLPEIQPERISDLEFKKSNSAFPAFSAASSPPEEPPGKGVESHRLQVFPTERSTEETKVEMVSKDRSTEATSATDSRADNHPEETEPLQPIPPNSVRATSRFTETRGTATLDPTKSGKAHQSPSNPFNPEAGTKSLGRRYFFLPAPLAQSEDSGQATLNDDGPAPPAVNSVRVDAQDRSGPPFDATPDRNQAEKESTQTQIEADPDSLNVPNSADEIPENSVKKVKNILRVYAWVETPKSPIFSWSPPITMQHSAAKTADIYARVWEDFPDNLRVIQYAPWAIYQQKPFQVPLEQLIINGPDLSKMAKWWDDFLWALEKRGLTPHRAALDLEAGFSYWQVKGPRVDTFQTLFSNPEARAVLPEQLLSIPPEGFDFRHAKNEENIKAWEDYAESNRARSFQEAFAAPLLRRFSSAKITNYSDGIRAAPFARDPNGWLYGNRAISGEASPVLYHKDVEANLLEVESTANGSKLPVVPWIPPPSFIGRDVWEQTVEGAVELGVREFLYWNAGVKLKLADDDAFAVSVMERINRELLDGNPMATSFD